MILQKKKKNWLAFWLISTMENGQKQDACYLLIVRGQHSLDLVYSSTVSALSSKGYGYKNTGSLHPYIRRQQVSCFCPDTYKFLYISENKKDRECWRFVRVETSRKQESKILIKRFFQIIIKESRPRTGRKHSLSFLFSLLNRYNYKIFVKNALIFLIDFYIIHIYKSGFSVKLLLKKRGYKWKDKTKQLSKEK